MSSESASPLLIGWGQADLTPAEPVLLAGQFHARVSEGVRDPVGVTALALEAGDVAVMVTCDLVTIADEVRDAVRSRLRHRVPDLEADKVCFNGTHTHTAPECRLPHEGAANVSGRLGIDLEVMDPTTYCDFAAERIVDAVVQAWESRAPGAVGYGLGQAVIGHNRRISYHPGQAVMYGKTDDPEFSHVEGYEDHRVQLLGTWDDAGTLTGLVVNVPCPSQVSESEYQVSADYWCETRAELRRRFGADLHVLGQCSAAGDQSPHHLHSKAAELRMLRLADRTPREEIAVRLADAVGHALPLMAKEPDPAPTLAHRVVTVSLPCRKLSEADVAQALAEAATLEERYRTLLAELEAEPQKREAPRWYVPITAAFRRARWCQAVKDRYEQQQVQPEYPVEIHVVRLGDVAFATNPFELYLDYGLQIQTQSQAVQTFVVQIAGSGTYLPTARAAAAGSYGAIPASTPVGPEGGRVLVERTVELIDSLW